jgi:hypothetical protein
MRLARLPHQTTGKAKMERIATWLALIAASWLYLPNVVAAGDSYILQSECQSKRVYTVDAKIQAHGSINPSPAGKTAPMAMTVDGHFDYDEIRLDSPQNGTLRSVRYYREAAASIQVNKHRDAPALADDKRLIVAGADSKSTALSPPRGQLTREELDLIDIPGNTLVLDQLLPGRELKEGETWKIPDAALAQLLCVDVVSRNGIQCQLGDANDATAKIKFGGTLDAAVAGVSTEIQLEGSAVFDFKHKCLTSIQMRIKERRPAGYIGPQMDIEANVEVQIEPREKSEYLTPAVLKEAADLDPFAQPLLLRSEFGAFHLIYDRRWHVTRNEAERTVMRLIDRGELVAQCNLTPLPRLDEGKTVTIEEFQAEIQKSLGKRFDHFETVAEGKGAGGIKVLKVFVAGIVSDIPIQWRYYLVIAPDGHRLAITYTLENELVQRFADADAAMTESIEFDNPTPPTAAPAQ